MKTAIIIHGKPPKEEYLDLRENSPSNKHWIPWVQHQLNIKGVLTQTPEMPNPYEPVYEEWKLVFEQFNIDNNTSLIGHSCGGGFLIRWLSEQKNIMVDNIILVAPWLDLEHHLKTNFFNFTIDSNITDRAKKISIFYSTDDDDDILGSVNRIKNIIPSIYLKKFINHGHFTYGDMKTDKFPELVEEILSGLK